MLCFQNCYIGPTQINPYCSLLFFNPDFKDDVTADEQGVDALELAKQSEQSLNDLLGLKEDEEDEENILLEIDSQLESKKKVATGEDVIETSWVRFTEL